MDYSLRGLATLNTDGIDGVRSAMKELEDHGYRILREGKILSLKVGRAYRIPKAHLFTYLCIGCGETVTV